MSSLTLHVSISYKYDFWPHPLNTAVTLFRCMQHYWRFTEFHFFTF